MVEGDGLRVRDTEGKTYIDALSGPWCASLGFSNEGLIRAAERQLRTLPYYHSFLGRGVEPTVRLAERLAAFAPEKLTKVFFGCSGSEAVESACKFAWYYHHARGRPGKQRIIARRGAYHGSGILSAGLTSMSYCHTGFGLPGPLVVRAARPHYFADAKAGESEAAFSQRLAADPDRQIGEEGADTIAAFIGEPVIGSGGVIPPPEGYWDEVQAVLARHVVLLIADEIITGFGRTGARFACDRYGIEPDMMTVAKQLSSGYFPISATLLSEEVYQLIAEHSSELGVLGHGFTYGGHPVGAAVALEALNQYEELDIERRVPELARHLEMRLAELRPSPKVADVRQAGLMAGVELHLDFRGDSRAKEVAEHCERNGVLFRMIDETIAMSPPLIVEPSDIDDMVTALRRAIDEVN